MNLASKNELLDIIRKRKIHLNKGLGQNFLIDENIRNGIVESAGINNDDYVLEIGPGIGTLTQKLCDNAFKVIAVEIDRSLIPVLSDNMKVYKNLKIIQGDILKMNPEDINREFAGHTFKVAANLPYYITTPIIMYLIENNFSFESLTVMVQKELGDRIVASPGSKDYGILSIAVQYYTKPEKVLQVPASSFLPKPKVDSCVIKLSHSDKPAVEVKDKNVFFEIVKASFSQRRKMLRNTLSSNEIIGLEKDKVLELLEQCGIAADRRAETVSIKEYGMLADKLYDIRSSKSCK